VINGVFRIDGQGVGGVEMDALWQSPSIGSRPFAACSAYTNTDGVALCSTSFAVPQGTAFSVEVTFTYEGRQYETQSTSSTH
jgi:hypothetical protein